MKKRIKKEGGRKMSKAVAVTFYYQDGQIVDVKEGDKFVAEQSEILRCDVWQDVMKISAEKFAAEAHKFQIALKKKPA